MQGPDAEDKQMKLFSILLLCNGCRAGDAFPLLLNMGAGMTIRIVVYKHSMSLLGATCVNFIFALASFLLSCILHLPLCLCCLTVGWISPNAQSQEHCVGAAAILLSSHCMGTAPPRTQQTAQQTHPSQPSCCCQVPEQSAEDMAKSLQEPISPSLCALHFPFKIL